MKGVLDGIINDVYQSKSLDECKQLVTKCIMSSAIRAEDKRKIIHNTEQSKSLIKLQQYITNSYFYFNKMGV